MATAEESLDGSWLWSEAHGAAGRVVQVDHLWGETVYTLWLPSENHVVRVPARQVRTLDTVGQVSPAELSYVAAAHGPIRAGGTGSSGATAGLCRLHN